MAQLGGHLDVQDLLAAPVRQQWVDRLAQSRVRRQRARLVVAAVQAELGPAAEPPAGRAAPGGGHLAHTVQHVRRRGADGSEQPRARQRDRHHVAGRGAAGQRAGQLDDLRLGHRHGQLPARAVGVRQHPGRHHPGVQQAQRFHGGDGHAGLAEQVVDGARGQLTAEEGGEPGQGDSHEQSPRGELDELGEDAQVVLQEVPDVAQAVPQRQHPLQGDRQGQAPGPLRVAADP